jgi:hypothetical protein
MLPDSVAGGVPRSLTPSRLRPAHRPKRFRIAHPGAFLLARLRAAGTEERGGRQNLLAGISGWVAAEDRQARVEAAQPWVLAVLAGALRRSIATCSGQLFATARGTRKTPCAGRVHSTFQQALREWRQLDGGCHHAAVGQGAGPPDQGRRGCPQRIAAL